MLELSRGFPGIFIVSDYPLAALWVLRRLLIDLSIT